MDGAQVVDRSQRGATLVQYALVVALIGLVVLAAVSKMGSGSKDTFQAAGTGVHTEGASGGAGGSGGSGGGSEGHPATTAATTPPTTAPPATTTTTKAPTTTTTTTPPTTTTTTTAAPKAASASFASSQGVADSSSLWHARTEVLVRTSTSEAVPGASVELLIEGWSSTGGGGSRRSSQVVTVATDADGSSVVDTATAARTGSSRVNSITIKVQDVAVPGGFVWSGATPSTSINRI